MTEAIAKRAVLGLLCLFYLPYIYLFGFNNVRQDNVDFPTFYSAAQVAFERGASPYTRDAFADDVSLLGEPAPNTLTGRVVPPFLYPPPSLLLFYPLTFFSFRTAKLLLLILNHLAILPIVYLFCTKIVAPSVSVPARYVSLLLAIVYVLVSYPVLANLEYGQINLFVLVLLGVTWLAVKKESHPLLIALPLAGAVLLKTYPILLLPLLLATKHARAAVYTVAALLVTTATAWLILPPNVWSDWLTNVVPTGGYLQDTFNLFSPAQSRNSSINGFVSRIFTEHRWSESLWPQPSVGRVLAYVMALLVMAATVGASWRLFRDATRSSYRLDLNFATYLLMIILVAPLSWESHLVFALPAAFIAIPMLLERRGRTAWQFLLMFSLCVIAWPVPVDHHELTKGAWTLVIPVKFYATVTLWAFFVQQAWRGNSQPEADSTATLSASPA